jgi:hypothetical protein
MSQAITVQKEKQDVLTQYIKNLEREYIIEIYDLPQKQKEKREKEKTILRKLGFERVKEYRELVSQKTKMIQLEIPFNKDVLEKIKKVKDEMKNDEALQKVRAEISALRKELRELHKNNRYTFFTEINPALNPEPMDPALLEKKITIS